MTTRQRLNRRFWLSWISGVVAFMFVAGLRGLIGAVDTVLLAVVGATPIPVALLVMFRTRCVHCGQPLRWFGMRWRPGAYSLYSPPCPNCRKDIDRRTANPR